MARYAIGFIGTGPEPDNPVWGESAAMAYRHASGYERLDECEILACADLVEENARAFAEEFDVADEHVYGDAETMLEEARPDVVSISTPVPTHAPLVLTCLQSGIPEAIHCEKPMATEWGDCRLMAQEADRRDVQVTFNHQRRLAYPWRDAKRLVDDGEIGDLRRIEVSCGELLDNGTHYIDLANYYAGDRPAEWVIGNLDYREEHVKYGAHNENQSLALWQYDDGVHGLASTGVGEGLVSGTNRLIGTDGVIETHPGWGETQGLRIRRAGQESFERVETPERDGDDVELAIEHVIESLAAGEEPLLSARRALNATEIIFGTYESSRKRGRVEFPLSIDDNPLEAMVESGDLDPASPE